MKIFSEDQLSLASKYIHLKQSYSDTTLKYKLKNEFYFNIKDKIQRQVYLSKNNTKIEQMSINSINKKFFKQYEKQNLRLENSIPKRSQFSQQIQHKKMTRKNEKYIILGGGCRPSRFQFQNQQQISYSQKKGILDERFMQDYEYYTNKKKIAENIEYERQGAMQVDIISCLKSYIIHIRRNIIIYKNKLMKLIEVYLIYVLTGSSQKEVLKQNEIQELGSLIKDIKDSFEMESQDQPSCELIFFFDILYRFNSTRIGKDEQNKSLIIHSVELVTSIVKLGAVGLKTLGGNFMEGVDLALQGAQSLLKSYQQFKANQLFSYLLDIWVRKTVQFKDRIWDLTFLEEIQFYITIFNELCSKKDYETDLVLLTLIKIDHYFSLAAEDKDNFQTLRENLSLNCELIKIFLPMLVLKSNSESFFNQMQAFLKFTVQSHTFRFLSISILLKYNKIIQDTNDFLDYKENIIVFLSYKYLCEKIKSVKLAYETCLEFIEIFNSKIQQEQFQNKIIQLSKERSNNLKSLLDLEGYEEKIDNSQDIERMIAEILIDKWERDIKNRQLDEIIQKDDILLEVKDLYISQSITYLEGNKIFQSKKLLTQINEKNQLTQRSNALQEILDNFLSVQTKENINTNISGQERLIGFKILGILAEGGTGKSMLMKKLETYLIQSANCKSEKVSFIPFLIKCNSLDPVSPSIENYLLSKGINQQQISAMKTSDRYKVILLDGYDEFKGEYFRVYQQLNLHKWKNTKIIVTSRNEKLELKDACAKFSIDGDNGQRDENSFCITKLEEFTRQDIIEYCQKYLRQYRTKEQQCDELKYQNDMDVIIDCMKNQSLENLLYLPINLYLFSRMVVQIKDKTEIQKIKESIYDQIGIQEIFFNEQFKREAQDFIQTQIQKQSIRKKYFSQLIINSFFDYFQYISMQMFLNKGKKEITNFLQIRNDKIEFKLSNEVKKQFSVQEQNSLHKKVIHYINSKIITRLKEETSINQINTMLEKNNFIEFRHKSLFEYFVARAMKYDFDVHGDKIYKLSIDELKEFSINKKSIMDAGQNQSEQQILIKLFKMIKNEVESNEFYSTYHLQQIEKNSRYIQYIKRSTIKKCTETSQIDIGASNMLTTLFFSRFLYSRLELSCCSLSKLYVPNTKSDSINMDSCNLSTAYLKNLHINYDSCNTQDATFDAYQKVFDTSNIFSFNQVIWDKRNVLYSISESGFINAFNVENKNILLQKSKQLSQTPLSQVLAATNDTLLVSSQYSLLLINSSSFDLLQSYKFKSVISGITLIKEKVLVTLKDETVFHGSFKIGFRKVNVVGSGCVYNESKQTLLAYSSGNFSLYNSGEEENFKLINTIKGHDESIYSVAFSTDGKYLATGAYDNTCKIWNLVKDIKLVNTIQGHNSPVFSVTFSADGKYLATGAVDKTCKIWNADKDFELLKTIEGHTDYIRSVTFSADGKYLATGSSDLTCKVWNVEKDFQFINGIQGHTSNVNSVALSADGQYLATGSSDNTCKVWNVQKGFELITTIQGHSSHVNAVTFSTDGEYLVTGSQDKTCKIWNVKKDFELTCTLQGHVNDIFSVAFSVDGKYFATGSLDKTCKIWNAKKHFELITTIECQAMIYFLAFSADGKYLATACDDNTSKIWNVENGFELKTAIKGHTKIVYSVAFSSDGKYLATGSVDKTCKIWNVEKDFELITSIKDHASPIYTVAFSTDGKYLATGSQDKTCKVWNAEKGFELINSISGHISTVYSVAFSADGKYLVTCSVDKTCKVWNAEKNIELISAIQGHTGFIRSLAFSANGKYLATSSVDKTCKIWNAGKDFELISTISGHASYINSAAFSANGKYLATGSSDLTCKIWDSEKGFRLITTIQAHTSDVSSVAFSADAKYLATGSSDSTCKIWNAEKGFELTETIQAHASNINSIAFSADGKYLATGSDDSTCKIWNAEKGFDLLNTISSHTSYINSVSFSTKGNYLAIGYDDSICKIWNTEKGFELISTIQGHNSTIFSVAFSVDGKYLATGSNDNTCKIWDARKDYELISTIQGHTSLVFSVAFSVNGKYLATGSLDKTCKIWNIEKGLETIKTIQEHTFNINSLALSADGKYLATGSIDKTCKIWDVERDFELLTSISGHTDSFLSIAFSVDGKYLATSSDDKTCKIWNAEKSFELINTIQCHAISSVAFSADGKCICIIEQNDKNYKSYDLQNFKIISEQTQNKNEQEKQYNSFNKNNWFQKIRVFENVHIL